MKKLVTVFCASVIALFGANVHVYKSPACGCCTKWGEHMEKNGFTIAYENIDYLYGLKQKMQLPLELASCHTAVVKGYIVEGHVPSDAVKKLLRQKPKDALGIAVAGMPLGSPGMEYGDKKDAYEVIIFYKNGTQKVFASY
jgi:hypothetical protein